MPYIPKDHRCGFEFIGTPQTPGELNFCITLICLQYLASFEERYQYYNDVIGALEGAKLEMYRRRISKYEDAKRKEHGDVYNIHD